MEAAQVLRNTRDHKRATALAPKMDEVVCAHFFRRKGAKPILQATVYENGIRGELASQQVGVLPKIRPTISLPTSILTDFTMGLSVVL
jgi:hypothetical protein